MARSSKLLLLTYLVSIIIIRKWLEEHRLIVAVPGYKTGTCNNLRLWGSKAASGEFDFQKFNSGEYESSVAEQQRAETISAVLYPNDK